ncbi:hypothetical protein LXL04_029811 [Taraxacum kok-saghyz]
MRSGRDPYTLSLTLVFIILSPMLIILCPVLVPFSFILWMCLYITGEHPVVEFVILSPMLAPASFIFWVCLYVTGEHPIGADWVDETLKKIVEVTEDIYVKNKLNELSCHFRVETLDPNPTRLTFVSSRIPSFCHFPHIIWLKKMALNDIAQILEMEIYRLSKDTTSRSWFWMVKCKKNFVPSMVHLFAPSAIKNVVIPSLMHFIKHLQLYSNDMIPCYDSICGGACLIFMKTLRQNKHGSRESDLTTFDHDSRAPTINPKSPIYIYTPHRRPSTPPTSMADDGSDHLVFHDQLFYKNLVKIIVPVIFAGPIIMLSLLGLLVFLIFTLVLIPVFIIMSPVLLPASFIFWMCSYFSGEHPIGADGLEEARKKIVQAAVFLTYNWI